MKGNWNDSIIKELQEEISLQMSDVEVVLYDKIVETLCKGSVCRNKLKVINKLQSLRKNTKHNDISGSEQQFHMGQQLLGHPALLGWVSQSVLLTLAGDTSGYHQKRGLMSQPLWMQRRDGSGVESRTYFNMCASISIRTCQQGPDLTIHSSAALWAV